MAQQHNLQYMLPPLLEMRLELLDKLLIGTVPVSVRIEILSSCRQQAITRVDAIEGQPTDDQIRGILQQLDPPEEVLRIVGISTIPALGQQATGPLGTILAPSLRRPVIRIAWWGFGSSLLSLLGLFGLPLGYLFFALFLSYFSPAMGSQSAALTAGISYLALIVLSALIGMVSSTIALYRIRRSNGANSGLGIATSGILVGFFSLIVSLLIQLLIILNM